MMLKSRFYFSAVLSILLFTVSLLIAGENADIIVAKDGSGDFTTIQAAINSVPTNNAELKIILIKNGVYNEKIRIDTDFIALVGEDRDSTRIEYYEPYVWDSVYVAIGRAVLNIYADDITLANLTIENTQPEVSIHAFTIYGTNNNRTIIINCNIISNGGDTLSLWNGETGMYYHNTLYLQGAVDFLCPRGWCYVDNIEFYCTRYTTPLWHDGSKNKDQKFVVKNSTFDGATRFNLGRNHHDGAFYLINLEFAENLNNQDWTRPASSEQPYTWGRRYYYSNCVRPAGNYDWFRDNMITAEGSPNPEDVTPAWTFANKWDPEKTMPSVLPFAFLPKPDNKQIRVGLEPELTWIPGRNAQSHRVYFGTSNPPEFVTEVTERSYSPGTLEPDKIYYWRIDEVDDGEIIAGPVWHFRTRVDYAPPKAVEPFPPDKSTDLEGSIDRLFWKADTFATHINHFYLGTHPDSLKLVSNYSVAGYYLPPLKLGDSFYWRVDLENEVGLTQGDVWQFSMKQAEYSKADYLQQDNENGIVSIEVEDYTDHVPIGEHAWEFITDPAGFSGKGAMQLLPHNGQVHVVGYTTKCSRLDYSVDFIKGGTHYIWIRAYSKDGRDNLFHLTLNGKTEASCARIGNFTATGQWEWIHTTVTADPEISTVDVQSLGIQRLSLYYGRDGIIADKIVLTTNPDYVPTGTGPDSTYTSVESHPTGSIPQEFYISPNYPNPFNPATRFCYTLPNATPVKLEVYDILGRKVASLVDAQQPAGQYTAVFDGTRLSSGVYLYQFTTANQVIMRKMMLLK